MKIYKLFIGLYLSFFALGTTSTFAQSGDQILDGIGETGLFRGLSIDDVDDYQDKLKWACKNINLGLTQLLSHFVNYPSIQFGLEQAFLSLESSNPYTLFSSKSLTT